MTSFCMLDFVKFTGTPLPLGFSHISSVHDFVIIEVKTETDLLRAVKNSRVDIVFNVETLFSRDALHSKNSGLNQVILCHAAQNNVAIGFNFSLLLRASDAQRPLLLGRMIQNVLLCRKYKVRMVLSSLAQEPYAMRDAKDLLAFARVLGMTGKEAQEALSFTKKQKTVRIQ